jgi:hypothetical protein
LREFLVAPGVVGEDRELTSMYESTIEECHLAGA